MNGNFSGTVSLADGAITLDLKADVSGCGAAVGRCAAARRAGGADARALPATREGNVSANALSLRSGGLSVDGTVKMLPGGGIDADVDGYLRRCGRARPAGARARSPSQAKASGALATPDVSVTVTSDRMTVADREITGLELTASGKADLANPAANVALNGTVGGEPLTGSAVLATVDGRRAVKGLSLLLGQNRICRRPGARRGVSCRSARSTSPCRTSGRSPRLPWRRRKAT